MKIGLGIGIPATSSGMSILQQLQNIPGGGLTFFKDYRPNAPSLNADYSVGSPTAKYSASRSASAPETYTDSNGINQLLTTADVRRWKGGYYDATGFHVQSGEMIEAAGTNKQTRSNGAAYASGLYTGWSVNEAVAGDDTPTNVLCPELSGIASAASQRVQYTGQAGDDGTKYLQLRAPGTDLGAIAQNNVVTVSFWARSQTGNTGVTIKPVNDINDIDYNYLDSMIGSDIVGSLTTTWRRLTWTHTITPVGSSQANLLFYIQGVGNGDTVDFEVYGLQLEVSPYATSFIPTTTAALTRPAEVLKYETAGNRTAASETIYIKYAQNYSSSSLTAPTYLSDTDTDRRIFYVDNSSDSPVIYPNYTDSNTSYATSSLDPGINTSYVLAVTMQRDTSPYVSIYYNGGNVQSDTDNYTSPDFGTYFYLGATRSGTNFLDGLIQSVAIFSGAHDAATVAAVTNILNAGGL